MNQEEVLAAYRCLLRRARGGLPLTPTGDIQVDPGGPIAGRGMRGDQTLVVFDRIRPARMVSLEAEKRVIATNAGSLRITVRLSWREEDETAEHLAAAAWECSPAMAAHLAAGRAIAEPSIQRESLATGDPGIMLVAAPGFNAAWNHTLPGFFYGKPLEPVGGQLAADEAAYHMRAIEAVVQTHPWLCLLTAYMEPFSLAHLIPLHDYSKYMLSSVPAC